MEVPVWWVWASGIYFALSIVWSVALCIAAIMIWKKTMPVIEEARVQMRRVTGQARNVAAKVSNTADIVHAQTQHLLGNAQQAGNQVTRQARTVGTALTVALVTARVVNFVRRVL